jgi:hypothetical protein
MVVFSTDIMTFQAQSIINSKLSFEMSNVRYVCVCDLAGSFWVFLMQWVAKLHDPFPGHFHIALKWEDKMIRQFQVQSPKTSGVPYISSCLKMGAPKSSGPLNIV